MKRQHRRWWVACLAIAALLGACTGGSASRAPTAAPTAIAPTETPAPTAAPAPTPIPTPPASAAPAAIRVVLDVPYANALTPKVKDVALDVYVPTTPGPRPMVIWGPGGEQGKSNGISFGRKMAGQGAVVLVIDISHGSSPNDEPLGIASRALFEEADCAVRMARSLAATYGGDPDRVVWTGYSFGGVVGFELGLSDPNAEQAWDAFVATNGGPARQYSCVASDASIPLTALVVAGSAPMVDVWPDTYAADPKLREFVDAINRIGNNPGLKVRMIHGTDDGDLPYAIAQGLANRLRAAGYDAELTPVEGGAHLPYDDLVVAKVLEILGG
jgi:dienelactone hydrolase